MQQGDLLLQTHRLHRRGVPFGRHGGWASARPGGRAGSPKGEGLDGRVDGERRRGEGRSREAEKEPSRPGGGRRAGREGVETKGGGLAQGRIRNQVRIGEAKLGNLSLQSQHLPSPVVL